MSGSIILTYFEWIVVKLNLKKVLSTVACIISSKEEKESTSINPVEKPDCTHISSEPAAAPLNERRPKTHWIIGWAVAHLQTASNDEGEGRGGLRRVKWHSKWPTSAMDGSRRQWHPHAPQKRENGSKSGNTAPTLTASGILASYGMELMGLGGIIRFRKVHHSQRRPLLLPWCCLNKMRRQSCLKMTSD